MEWSWNLAGAVILSGLVIVFLVLIILIVVVNVTGRLTGSIKKTEPTPPAAPTTPSAPTNPAATPSVPAPSVEQGISGETVAVITAAVTAMMDEQAPGTAYAVTGIQHARSQRPVWGFAGMQQNTRPF